MIELLLISLVIALPFTAVACFFAGATVANRSRAGLNLIQPKSDPGAWPTILEKPNEDKPYIP
jgi:hypothetical protein